MKRPIPSATLLEPLDTLSSSIRLTPAPEIWEWLQAEILADTGTIHNEDHAHLLDADIRVMWASSSFEKQGRTVLGQAEQVAFRAGGWQKARMEQQMRDWFGDVPAFIITLAADYCVQCSDLEFCALIEADNDSATEHSVLSLVVSNVSEAYSQCLAWMAEFVNATGETLYKLNQDFSQITLDATILTGLFSAVQGGKLPSSDFWQYLRDRGVIDPEKTDDQIRDELETESPGPALDDTEVIPNGGKPSNP